jgi:hypothetical protein
MLSQNKIGLKLLFASSLKGLVRVWTNLFFWVKVNLKGLDQHFLRFGLGTTFFRVRIKV